MLRALGIVSAIVGSLMAATIVSAQTPKSNPNCEDGIWRTLSGQEVAERGLDERLATFVNAAKSVSFDSAINIQAFVIDCPIQGYVRRTIKSFGGVNFGTGARMPAVYNMYLTAAYLRQT